MTMVQLSLLFLLFICIHLQLLWGFKLNPFFGRKQSLSSNKQIRWMKMADSPSHVKSNIAISDGFIGPFNDPLANATNVNSVFGDFVKVIKKEKVSRPGLKAFARLHLRDDLSRVSLAHLRTVLKAMNSLQLLNCSENEEDRHIVSRVFDSVFSGPDVHPSDFIIVLSELVKNESRFMTFPLLNQCVDSLHQLGLDSQQYSSNLTSQLLDELFCRMGAAFPLYPAPAASDLLRLWSKIRFRQWSMTPRARKQLMYLLNRNVIHTNVISYFEGKQECFVNDEKDRMILLNQDTTNRTFVSLLLQLPDEHLAACLAEMSNLKIKWSCLPTELQLHLLTSLDDRRPTMRISDRYLITASVMDMQPPFDQLPPPLQQDIISLAHRVFGSHRSSWRPRLAINMAKMGMKIGDNSELKSLYVKTLKPIFTSDRSVINLLTTLRDLGLVHVDLTERVQAAIKDALQRFRLRLKGRFRVDRIEVPRELSDEFPSDEDSR